MASQTLISVLRRCHELVGGVSEEAVKAVVASEVMKLDARACGLEYFANFTHAMDIPYEVISAMIYTSKTFVCSVFAFPRIGATLPFHDHPGITGFVRPIAGRMAVSSFALITDETEAGPRPLSHHLLRPARFEGKRFLDANTPSTSVLDPINGQIHAIESLTPVSAFVDVLAPGYDNVPCTYYACDDPNPEPGRIYWLRVVPETVRMAPFYVEPVESSDLNL
uniref:2-aminoethanethiol dioxygenase n=1 Tax=Panagrellus redivivus TaxID=6233 RepID=A0A7E4W393_PANRE